MANSLLGVHLIGAGYGESVIIELPDGRVGLIDCYAPRRSTKEPSPHLTHPVIRFMESRGIKQLAFVALTHPHEDHGRGMPQVLEYFEGRIDQIWMFHGWDTAVYLEQCCIARKKQWKKKVEAEEKREPDSFGLQLRWLRHLVLKQTRLTDKSRAELKEFTSEQRPISFGNVGVCFLGPRLGRVKDYVARMTDRVKEALDNSEDWRKVGANHNTLSPAILIEYGETRILLGGDMEEASWKEALEFADSNDKPLKSHFIKLSHHGSKTGTYSGMYEKLTMPGQTVAALTPYDRGRKLPDRHGIGRVYPYVTDLFATNIEAATDSTGGVAHRAVPLNWTAAVTKNLGLSAVLDPGVVDWSTPMENLDLQLADDSSNVPCDTIPLEWVRDLIQTPQLSNLLSDNVVEKEHGSEAANIEQACRVAFFYDEHGKEQIDLRHVGDLAGHLGWRIR